MSRSLRLTALAAALCTAFSATASDENAIVVTATRTAQTVDETLAAVTVITREDIRREQAQSLQDLLRASTGISVSNNGGAGKASSLFVRGTESDHILVLIDGVKVGSATLGTTSFQDLPLELIERIEIVRGPRSSLYGSEAIGGVIQIFTRRGGDGLRPQLSVGAGSRATYTASAAVSGGSERSWFNIAARHSETDGFNACRGSLSAGCFTIEPDDDGYRNQSASLRGGYRFDVVELDFHALQTEGESDFDGGFQNESESTQQVVGGSIAVRPLAAWKTALSAGSSRDVSRNRKDGVFASRFETTRNSLNWQNDIGLGDAHLLTAGASFDEDRIASSTAYAVRSRDNTGVFAQYQGAFGDADLQLSLRNDDNEQFGEHATGGAALGYALTDALRLRAAWGNAFKAPTFNELYFPGFGNANLRPETADSTELGIAGRGGPVDWSIAAFETRVENLIAFDAAIFAPNNIDQARIHGIELTTGARIDAFRADLGMTLLDPENRSSGANRGKVLPRRARESLRASVDYDFGRFRAGSTLVAEGSRYDDLGNTRRLAGYATIDLRIEYAFAKDWLLQGRVENAFDKAYETASFYNQPGRGTFVTLHYQP